MKVKHMHIKIPVELYDDLKQIKDDTGIDMTDIIILALTEKINNIKNADNN